MKVLYLKTKSLRVTIILAVTVLLISNEAKAQLNPI